MFEARDLHEDVAAVRDEYAPDAIVLNASTDFETLPAASLDDVAMRVDEIHPHEYDPAWLPPDSPELLRRLTSNDLVVGMPGDGSVAWTTQTTPPVVIVKARVEGSPDDFVDFLVAEALVEAGLDTPEHLLGLFQDQYLAFAEAVPHDPHTTYQLAAAITDAYRGLHTRGVFETWPATYDHLGDAWTDAGDRLASRLVDLPRAVARGRTQFTDAAELACAGIKHDLDIPAPFGAFDTLAFREHGAEFAVKWAERLFE